MNVRSFGSLFVLFPVLGIASVELAGCGSSDSSPAAPGPTGVGGAAAGAAGAAAAGTSSIGGAGTAGGAAGAGGDATAGPGGNGGSEVGGTTGAGGKGGSAGMAAGGAMGGGGFQTAKHTPFPNIPKFSGPLLTSPQIITVTYAGYKYTKEVQAFGDAIVTSDWLTAWGAEYGVGAGAHLAKVELPDMPPATISDDELQMFITAKLADKTLPTPPGNPNDYLYVFYFPKSTHFKRVDGAASCQAFLGFHNGFFTGPVRVAYAVINDCGAQPGISELGSITGTSSHEIAEAATDPMPYNNPAYTFGGGGTLDPWRIWGSEVGDICEGTEYKDATGTVVQRIWSNANAKKNLDPCVPSAQPDGSLFSVSAAPSTLQQVNPGQVVTFKLTGWSTNPRADWNLSYSVWSATLLPKIALSSMTINNGVEVTLTLTVPNAAPSGTDFLMTIDSRSGGEVHPWPVGIFVP